MIPRSNRLLATLALAAGLLPAAAHAQLVITEVQSSEAASGRNDWWELSNFGSAPADITGYKFDDNSDSFASSVALPGFSIAPGESAVFVETTGTMTAQGFRDWWGLSAAVQVGTYSGSTAI